MIPTPARAALRSVAFALVTLALVTHPAARPAAAGPLDMLEGDFEKAISRITPATVECKPYGIPPEQVLGGSSGVIVSRKGYIFSDGDVVGARVVTATFDARTYFRAPSPRPVSRVVQAECGALVRPREGL